MNLYPSNILWKKVKKGKIVVRVEGWDTATFIGEDFTTEITSRLQQKELLQYYYKTVGDAEPKCDYWFVYILSLMSEKELKSIHRDEGNVDLHFRNAVVRLTREYGDDPARLRNAFEEWFGNLSEKELCNEA